MAHATWHHSSCHSQERQQLLAGSSSSLLVATFTQHLASHSTSAPLLTTSSPLPSPLAVIYHQDQKGLTPLLALLLVSICEAFLTTYALLPSHLSEDSHHEHFNALSYTSDHPKL